MGRARGRGRERTENTEENGLGRVAAVMQPQLLCGEDLGSNLRLLCDWLRRRVRLVLGLEELCDGGGSLGEALVQLLHDLGFVVEKIDRHTDQEREQQANHCQRFVDAGG